MESHKFFFLAGLHRSGTSLLHEIFRSHPDISGFKNTGVFEDEGQHLQKVYQPASAFGGPGRFGFNRNAYMDEGHSLVSKDNANKLFKDWSRYWDLEKKNLIEKSPPNLIRTRFLQALFPDSTFIVILRHPLAVAYATKKWSRKSPIPLLVEHNLRCYEIFLNDIDKLHNCYVLRYEDFVIKPQEFISLILNTLDLTPLKIQQNIRKNINQKYFFDWELDKQNFGKRAIFDLSKTFFEFEKRANVFGYSLKDPEQLLPCKIYLN